MGAKCYLWRMIYTDRFFLFPIKVYDTTLSNDKLYDLGVNPESQKDEVDWVEGYCRLPYGVLNDTRLYWYEGYSRDRTPEEVAKEGSDLTIVITKDHGEFVCTWDRLKFERKLNEFMENNESENKRQYEEIVRKMRGTPITFGDSTSRGSNCDE